MEEKDLTQSQESSPELEAAMAESAPAEEGQQAQDTGTATSQQAVSQEPEAQQETEKEPPLHQHPRFKEVIDEKNYWREMALKNANNVQQPVAEKKQEAEMGNTPEEREFWRMQRRVAKEEAERVAAEKEKVFRVEVDYLRKQQIDREIKEFKGNHPDVKNGSVEEYEVGQKYRQGYSLEDAYWAVMGPRGVKQAEVAATKKVQQQVQQKKQANVENSQSVSMAAKAKPNLTFEQELAREFDAMQI